MIWESIKLSFIRFYENSFMLVIINFIWILIAGFLGTFAYGALQSGFYVLIIIPLFFAGPLFLTGIKISDKAYLEEQIRIRDFFEFFKKLFKRGLLACIFSSIVYLIFIIDFYFFYYTGVDSTLMYVFFAGILFLFFSFSMMQLYFWPMLIIFPEQSLFTLIKKSFVLTFDNFIFSFLWIFVVLFFVLLFLYLRVIIPPFFMTLIGLFFVSGTRIVLRKYD